MTLFNLEAERVALSEAVKEVMFIMEISVELMVSVSVNNVVEIFLVGNVTTTSCTKHVDKRNKYVNKYVEYGMVEIVFVKSAENDSNILTKKLSGDLHEKHSGEKPESFPSSLKN